MSFRKALSAPLVALVLLAGCSSAPDAPASAPASSAPATKAAAAPRLHPASISVPSIDAESSLIVTGLNKDGTAEVPDVKTPKQASYCSCAPAPGEVGPALVLGHVNGNGQQGVFSKLHLIKVGAKVAVTQADGSVRTFEVYKREQLPKNPFPTDPARSRAAYPWKRILAWVPKPELRLITCTGDLDVAARSYEDNLVVYARQVA